MNFYYEKEKQVVARLLKNVLLKEFKSMKAWPQKARNRPDLTRFYPPFIVLGPSGGGKVPPGGLNQSLPVSLNPQTSLEPGELPDTPIKTDLDVSFPHQGHIKQVH